MEIRILQLDPIDAIAIVRYLTEMVELLHMNTLVLEVEFPSGSNEEHLIWPD